MSRYIINKRDIRKVANIKEQCAVMAITFYVTIFSKEIQIISMKLHFRCLRYKTISQIPSLDYFFYKMF